MEESLESPRHLVRVFALLDRRTENTACCR